MLTILWRDENLAKKVCAWIHSRQKKKEKKVYYLPPGAWSDPPQVDHVPRDAQHGGQGGEPAKSVRPPRILVVHVLYRSPLDEVEDEYALK